MADLWVNVHELVEQIIAKRESLAELKRSDSLDGEFKLRAGQMI